MQRRTILVIAAVVLVLLLGVSGIRPYDRLTWALEVFPIIVALPILFLTYRRFPLTTLLYALIFVHAIVLMVGGHHTYARVPVGFTIAKVLGLHRNPYDKIGHFAQGLVPAIAAREFLVRGRYIRTRGMLAFVVISIVLAISASYELFEWASAVALGQGADDFLGTQGDPWDTQSDMLLALIGGGTALIGLAGTHDRQLSAFQGERAGAVAP
jgi:putative membrane protein